MKMFSHWRWTTSKAFSSWNGRTFDFEKPVDVLRYNCWGVVQWIADAPMTSRRRLADRLARAVCWLRGEKWYVSDAWHGVPGNRTSELTQLIRDEFLTRMSFSDEDDKEAFERVQRHLNELGQKAGESWGHVWPKEEMKS